MIFINPTIIKDTGDLAHITGRNRQAASGFLDDKVIDALPENFFGELGNSPDTEAPEVKTATDTDDTIQAVPVENAPGGSSNWATPPPRRASE